MKDVKSFRINSSTILDSYVHLSSSLSTMINILPNENKIHLKFIEKDDDAKFKLIKQKGFYPY